MNDRLRYLVCTRPVRRSQFPTETVFARKIERSGVPCSTRMARLGTVRFEVAGFRDHNRKTARPVDVQLINKYGTLKRYDNERTRRVY